MSSTKNQKQSFWKTVEAQLRRLLVGIRTGNTSALTAEDAASWAKTLIFNCLILQDLLPDGSRLRSEGNLKQWCVTIAKNDILDVAKGMKEFQLFLRTYPDEWEFLSYNAFKQRYPYVFTGDFWSPVKDVLVSYLADPRPATFQVLNQWVSFPLKLTLKGMASDLTQKAEAEFLANEDRLAELEFSDYDCDAVADVLKSWFSGFNFTMPFCPHHSNGAVANRDTKRGLLGKYRNMTSDYRISSLYRKFGLNEAEYGFVKTKNPKVDNSVPCAKLITVPKGIDKRRMICPEPAEYQFNQQGIWDLLDDYIQRSKIVSEHIAIHDQSVNQLAALDASRYCDAATIDLSSASDSVSWQLVKRVFSKTPELLWCLWATRSTHVKLPSGTIVKTNKYAPMGSALCFPIESILFAAICQVADNRTKSNRIQGSRNTFHVYGDDIIVPYHAFDETCRLLTEFGFLINELKTFYPYSRYKESCGVECLDGQNVSVMGISRKYSGDDLTLSRPELVSCYIAFSNELWRKGYVSARHFLLAEVLCLPQDFRPPFSGDLDRGIFSPEPTNFSSKRRENADLQCEEIRVGCFTTTRDPDPFTTSVKITEVRFGSDYDSIRYLETLRRLASTKRPSLLWPEDSIRVSLCRSVLRLTSRWVSSWVYAREDDPLDWSVAANSTQITPKWPYEGMGGWR